MSQEFPSSESGRSDIRRSVRSTAGNRLRELIRLEMKKKQNDRYLQDTFEGLHSCGQKEGVEVLVAENSVYLDDESEYSTEVSSEDVIDSDFDDFASGDEEVLSEPENEQEPEVKRKRISKRLLTRSKSAPSKPTATTSPNEMSGASKNIFRKSKSKESSREKSDLSTTPTEGTRRSKRASTRQRTEEARQKQITDSKDKQERMSSVKNRKSSIRPLSQEELFKEAEHTEKVNTASLKTYLEMQIQKKRFVARKKHTISGPFIRYLSTSRVPNESLRTRKQHALANSGNATRVVNLIIHSHPEESPAFFRASTLKPEPELCPVTGLPAKYRDPLTKLPYYNAEAFKTIRANFAKEEEERYLSRINTLKDILNGKET